MHAPIYIYLFLFPRDLSRTMEGRGDLFSIICIADRSKKLLGLFTYLEMKLRFLIVSRSLNQVYVQLLSCFLHIQVNRESYVD